MSIPRLKRTHVLPRGRGVTVAQRAFTSSSEGSNPSDFNGSIQWSVFSRQFDPSVLTDN